MAKKNKPSFLKRLYRKVFSRQEAPEEAPPRKKMPQNFHVEWMLASEKWKQLLLTKQVEQGLVVERTGYKLQKTNEKLFRLEGENFSIVLVTGNTLYESKEGKISGILFVDEGNLNLAIQSDHSRLEGLLNRLDLPKTDMDFDIKADKLNNWREIQSWEKFWQEQLLLQISANTMALVILALGEDLKNFFESVATDRQKDFVRDEFFFLNAGKMSETSYPHGKNKNLFGFSSAVSEFSEKLNLIRTRREKENAT